MAVLLFPGNSAHAWFVPATTTTLTLSTVSAASGTPITLTAAATVGGAPIMNGQISLSYQQTIDGVLNVGSFGTYQITSAGTAVAVVLPGIGTYEVTASFAGLSSLAPSSSQPATLTVTSNGPYATATQFFSSGTPGNYTFSAEVGAFGLIPPTGSVSFVDTTGGGSLTTAILPSSPVSYGLLTASNSPLVDGTTQVLYVAAGDLNHDGLADIVSLDFDGTNPGTVQVRLGTGNGLFANPVSYALNLGQPNNVTLADVNHDGNPDLVVVSSELNGYDPQNQRVVILLGIGDGTFQVPVNPGPQVLTTGYGPNYTAVADLDGDGNLDIVVTNRSDNAVKVFLGDGSGGFSEQGASPFPSAGTSPFGVIVQDFNRDGIPDLAVSNAGGTQTHAAGSVSIFLGAGDGTFSLQNTYTTPGNAAPLVAGSLRGNGILDLVVPDGGNSGLYIFLGNGDGTFASTPITVATSHAPFCALLVDENHDGKLDIISTSYGFFSPTGMSHVTLFFGNGDGTFGPEQDFATGSAGIQNVATADFNNDGLPDVLSANFAGTLPNSGTVSLFLGDKYVTAQATDVAVPGPGPQAIEASYGGDSAHTSSVSATTLLLPIVTTTVLSSSPVSAPVGSPITLTATVSSTLQGPASGGMVSFYGGSTLLGTANVTAGSANFATSALPSGYTIVTAIYSGTPLLGTSTSSVLRVFVGVQSTTTLAASTNTAVAGTAIVLTSTTLDSPGGAPLTAGQVSFDYQQTAGSVVLNGSFGTAQITTAGTAALTVRPSPGTYVVTATFVGSSTRAPSASTSQTVTLTGNGSYSTGTALQSSGSAGDYTLVATVSGFGLSAPSGTLSFLNTTGGNSNVATAALDPASTLYMPLPATGSPVNAPNVQAVITGDVDGDGIADLVSVLCGGGSGGVNVQPGIGDGTFQAATSYTTGTCATAAAIADVNGDGVADIAVVNEFDNTVSILLGGNGTFVAQPDLQVANGGEPSAVTVADLNHDGNLDIIVANSQEADISVFLGAGDGTFQAEQTYPTGNGGLTLSVADLNGDGNLDVLISNSQDGTVGLLLGAGDGTFQAQTTFSVPYGMYGDHTSTLATGSLRGNGVIDLVTTDAYLSSAYIHLGNGNGSFAAPVTLALHNGEPDNALVTDVNHDGKLDVVVISVGQLGVFYGKGDGTFGAEHDFSTGQVPAGGQGFIYMVAADLNNDGLVDFVTTDTLNFTNAILLGQQSVTATANDIYVLGTGAQSIVASFPGDGTHAASVSGPVSLQPSVQSASSLILTTPNATVAMGSKVTLTATVSLAPTGASYGTISFYNGSSLLATRPVNASGVATYATTTLPAGSNSLTAVYSGNAALATSTSAVLVETVLTVTATHLSASSSSVTSGQAVTLTATVTPTPAGGSLGTISFYNGSSLLATQPVNASGMATYLTTSLPAGNDSLTAVYSGNATSATSTSAVLVESVLTSTSTTLITSSSSVSPGQAVTLTATVTPTPTGGSLGSVIFYIGTTSLGTGTLNSAGTASLSTSTLPSGSDAVTAVYSGNPAYAASTSAALSISVTAVGTTTAVSASTVTPTYGQSVTFTATVSPAPTDVTPGTVSFYVGSTLLGTSVLSASGAATLSTSTLPLGTSAITAAYSGSAAYTASHSGALSIANRAATSLALTASPTTQLFNNPIVLSAQATSSVAGAITGTVSFLDGTAVFATVPVGANGIATYPIATLATGSHNLTATYAGDGNFLPGASTGAAIAITVGNLNLDLGGDQNQSVLPGAAVSYNFPLSPLVTPTFLYDVHLTATGLPPGATYTFAPALIPAGSGSLPVTLTVQTAKSGAGLSRPPLPIQHSSSRGMAMLAGVFLLPLLGARPIRRRLRGMSRPLVVILFMAVSLGAMIGFAGCGAGGFYGPTAGNGVYTITVTATSADLVRSSTVQLTIQ